MSEMDLGRGLNCEPPLGYRTIRQKNEKIRLKKPNLTILT